MNLAHWTHDLDPVFFHLGPLPIRWYSLSYLLGVVLAMFVLQHLSKLRRIALTVQQVSDLCLMYAILGILIGGRLGWVLLYGIWEKDVERSAFWPFKIWEGGMASHGGILGVAIAMWIFSRRTKVPFVHVLDLVALVAPIGLCLGRIANFINGELWGRASDVPWAVIFPKAGDQIPRHPSQLYESFGEGMVLFVVLYALHRRLLPRTGAIASLFLFGYSLARIVCEQFRQWDHGLDPQNEWIPGMTRGQWLTLALVVAGVLLGWRALRQKGPGFQPVEDPAA